MPRPTAAASLLFAVLATALSALSTTFDYAPIRVPGIAGAQFSGINNAGEILGNGGAGEVSKGFLLSGSTVTTIFVLAPAGPKPSGCTIPARLWGPISAACAATTRRSNTMPERHDLRNLF